MINTSAQFANYTQNIFNINNFNVSIGRFAHCERMKKKNKQIWWNLSNSVDRASNSCCFCFLLLLVFIRMMTSLGGIGFIYARKIHFSSGILDIDACQMAIMHRLINILLYHGYVQFHTSLHSMFFLLIVFNLQRLRTLFTNTNVLFTF